MVVVDRVVISAIRLRRHPRIGLHARLATPAVAPHGPASPRPALRADGRPRTDPVAMERFFRGW